MPTAQSAGSFCTEVGGFEELEDEAKDLAAKAKDTNGGVSDEEAPVEEASLPPATWQKRIDDAKDDDLKRAEAAAKSKIEARVVNWDMRRLVAERLRAQTGADLAHGAALGSEVQLHNFIVKQNIDKVNKIKDALGPIASGIDEGVAAAEGDADKAKEASQATELLLRGAKKALMPTLARTRGAALDLIRQHAEEAAQEEAEAYAQRMDWDKPGSIWKRVIAERTAEPYEKAVVVAAQRYSEYRAVAGRQLSQADALERQAMDMKPQVESLKAEGDVPMSIDVKHQMDKLLLKSKRLRAQASEFKQTSEDAWKSMAEWQTASQAAAAYVSQLYDQEHPDQIL